MIQINIDFITVKSRAAMGFDFGEMSKFHWYLVAEHNNTWHLWLAEKFMF